MRYSAFISYNHRDRRWAGWLLRQLERYRIPKKLRGRPSPIGPLGTRLPPVFQDREELAASADLARSVQRALTEAASLIVICSPDGARSKWVNEEIRTFAVQGKAARIQCMVVDGELVSGARAEDGCLPPALFEIGEEPLAADIRKHADGRRAAVLKLIAGIIGVGYDELRQREAARRQRRLAVLAGSSAAGTVAMTGLAAFALISRAEAVHQRDMARQKTITAERTTDFVKSLFEVSDPSEAKGAKVTALEVLDKGARQIFGTLDAEPNVRAELTATLSEVYLNLGFFRRADALIRHSLRWRVTDPGTRGRQLLVLGDAQARNGDYAAALRSYDVALRTARDPDGGAPDMVSRTLVGRGEALSALDRFQEAHRSIAEALRLDRGRNGARSPVVARDLEAAGLNADFAGRLHEARGYYRQALAIRLAAQGAAHPRVSEDLSELGSLSYLQGDSASAETYWLRALKSDQAVLGPNHPDVATTMNNVGRVMLERREFVQALPILQRAVAINLRQRDDTYDGLAFTFANLAIAERGLGDLTRAEYFFRRALRPAIVHKHRNLAPILTDLADVRCGRGAIEEGLQLLARAEPIMRATYPNDPWRTAWVQNTRGYCLMKSGRPSEAIKLLKASAPVIEAKWSTQTLYGNIVRHRINEYDTKM